MFLTNEIESFLLKNGADIVGFADIKELSSKENEGFNSGILIAIKYSKEAIENNKKEDLNQYYKEFNIINKKLDDLAILLKDFLNKKGFKADAKLRSETDYNKELKTVLPHKTIATLSGIGWIGKCALLVTKDFGSAIRIITVLTDAEFKYGKPIEKSNCGEKCNICKDACPGDAISGIQWSKGIDRDDFYNGKECAKAAKKYAKSKLNIEYTLCGKCISNCPFTQKAYGYR